MTDAISCSRITRGMREPQEEAAGNEDYHETGRTDYPYRVFGADAEILYRLCDERDYLTCTAGYQGRVKAGTEADTL